ncbi:MAG: hypothetical protein P4L43_03145 [Syntrophobacteraceae bacterium]|nr:hypothetical protein [Syntrophobacteraceae bacterium]
MKKSVRKFPAVLSLVLLAAHFLRAQSLFFVAVNIGLTPLLFWKKRWLTQIVRIYLVLGCGLWVYTASMIVMEREALGLPFAGAAIILGSVAILTLASALLAAPEESVPARTQLGVKADN